MPDVLSHQVLKKIKCGKLKTRQRTEIKNACVWNFLFTTSAPVTLINIFKNLGDDNVF